MIRLNLFLLFVLFHFACSKKEAGRKADNVFYKKAYQYRDEAKSDSAFYYFDRARDQFLQEKDSVKAASCLVNMAIISTNVGDYFGAQELALGAIPYFNEDLPKHRAFLLSNYNNLGIASNNLKQHAKAIEFYTRSLDFVGDSSYTLVVKNNIANAHRNKGDYATAIEMYRSILLKEKKPINYTRVLSNYAYTKWLQRPQYPASAELHNALSIRLHEKDEWGQHASYAHLADYYMKTKPDSALIFARRMYELAITLQSTGDQLEALQKLISLSPSPDARHYFHTYQRLDDSIQTARNNAKNQFALIRYETERHKARSLVLEQKNTTRAFWILSLMILLVAAGSFFIFWHTRRTRHLELEAKNALQAARLKTSKKVHDVVANGIYRIMSELENNADADQEKILDQMEILYERSRDISYDEPVDDNHNFDTVISQLLLSFQSAEAKVLIFGNDDKIWACLSKAKMNELKHVLQELMVNMKKHSRASSVAIRFENRNDHLEVYYTDNGLGMAENTNPKNGLSNTGNRINGIGGTITFGKANTGGLNVHIQIPCDSKTYA